MISATKVQPSPIKEQKGCTNDVGNKAPQLSFAEALLTFESSVRDILDEGELLTSMCNNTRKFVPFRQSFLLKGNQNTGLKLLNASSIAIVDRDAPLIRWLEKVLTRMINDVDASAQQSFSLPAYCDDADEEKITYPFSEFLWTPLKDDDQVIGGWLTVRERAWSESERIVAQRLAGLYTHSWRSLKASGKLSPRKIFSRNRFLMAGAGLLAIMCWPVHITALAPVEISPTNPHVIAAPFDGVVKEILVEQGEVVEQGAPLIAFEDVLYRNEFDIADRNQAVAEARFQRSSQGAINDAQQKREIAVTRAEYALAVAERKYAAELLEKTTAYSDYNGIAVFTDKRDWVGHPVAAGEAILQVADPTRVRFAIDLPIKESLVLEEGARVKVYLDSDPLNPIEAELVETSYEARPDKRDILSFRIYAETLEATDTLRIGVQGAAKVYGEKAPLGYVILRRPLSAFRQLTGI